MHGRTRGRSGGTAVTGRRHQRTRAIRKVDRTIGQASPWAAAQAPPVGVGLTTARASEPDRHRILRVRAGSCVCSPSLSGAACSGDDWASGSRAGANRRPGRRRRHGAVPGRGGRVRRSTSRRADPVLLANGDAGRHYRRAASSASTRNAKSSRGPVSSPSPGAGLQVIWTVEPPEPRGPRQFQVTSHRIGSASSRTGSPRLRIDLGGEISWTGRCRASTQEQHGHRHVTARGHALYAATAFSGVWVSDIDGNRSTRGPAVGKIVATVATDAVPIMLPVGDALWSPRTTEGRCSGMTRRRTVTATVRVGDGGAKAPRTRPRLRR